MEKRRSLTTLFFIAAILQVVWGLVPSASKVVIDEIPVELYIALRWTISGIIFAVYLYVTKSWKPVGFKSIVWVSLLGIFGYGIASLGTLYGLKVGGVTNFALMGALSPVITTVIALWILKEKPSRLFYFALPACVLGLLLLVIGKYQVSTLSVAGLSALFIIGGYVCEAFVFVFSKKFKAEMSAAQYLAIAQMATAILMWIMQGVAFHQSAQLSRLSVTGIIAATFVSVVACVLCYAVLYWLLNYVDGHRLALFDGFHTLSATAFGYFFFREEIKPMMIFGGVLILVGLITGNLPRNLMEESPE